MAMRPNLRLRAPHSGASRLGTIIGTFGFSHLSFLPTRRTPGVFMKNMSLPIVLITIGAVWLAHVLGWLPDLRSVGAIALVVAGVAVLAIEGITKASVVSGPMLIFSGGAWYAWDHELLTKGVIAPLFLIVLGLCIFAARMPSVPVSRRPRETADTSNQPGVQ